jgi:hypothetical protein
MEPRFFENQLWIGGMPGTAKLEDLVRDPRFALHTATVDTQVTDGDAKVWGTVDDVHDDALHQRYADALFADAGLDLRGLTFAVGGGHMDVTMWREGGTERVVRKH